MKKTYESPNCEQTELTPQHIIAISIPGKPNENNNDDEWANEYDAKESRNDWENIWANLE